MPRSVPHINNSAIFGNLKVLAEIVGQVVEAIGEAQALQSEGRQSEAMGGLP
jgi:hypothetical protein